MPLYDLYCTNCGKITEELLGFDDVISPCSSCGSERKKICNCKTFKLVYNNKTDMCAWGDDGYSSSCYWNDYKRAKSEGEDVKPSNDC